MERCVPYGEERVSKAQDVAHGAFMGLVEEIRFTALAVQVRVRAEERRERANPVPTYEHFRFRVAEKAADISCVSHCVLAQ